MGMTELGLRSKPETLCTTPLNAELWTLSFALAAMVVSTQCPLPNCQVLGEMVNL
jgi:hypothetical protein